MYVMNRVQWIAHDGGNIYAVGIPDVKLVGDLIAGLGMRV